MVSRPNNVALFGAAPRTFRLLGICVVLAMSGCSLLTTDMDSCEVNADCRAEFGLGAVCAQDGYCELSLVHPRCTKTFPDDLLDNPIEYKDSIVVGNLMDRSLGTHQARENSAQLAFKGINVEGGVEGQSFGVIFCTIEVNSDFDDLTRPEAAVASARYLVDDIGVPAIIGPAASSDTQAVFMEVKPDQVLIISPSATSPALEALDDPPFNDSTPGLLWRTAPPDSLQGRAIADDMTRPGAERQTPVSSVAAVHETGAYGEALAAVFANEFSGQTSLFPYDDPTNLPEATAAAGGSPAEEVLFISSQSEDVIAFLNAATPLPSSTTRIPVRAASCMPHLCASANGDTTPAALPGWHQV